MESPLPFNAPVRCLRGHANATRAKWAANLLRRLPGQTEPRKSDRNSHHLTWAQIADRMEAICVAGTPEGSIEVAGAAIRDENIFNLYSHAAAFYHTAVESDPFPWRDVLNLIAERPELSFGGVPPEAFARYSFTWQERERLRLATGIYKDVPWTLPPVQDHFVHISTQSQGTVAFTETDEKGARDIQTPMKAGRYLKKFYQHLSDTEVEELQARVFKDDDIHISTSPDDIERAFVTGPQSCMSGDATRWGSKVVAHPARAYGNGDLALAHITNRKGKCSARAVVWPAKKLYFKTYGDPKLAVALEKMGYHQGDNFCFQGAKLKVIPNGNGTALCPHIDGNLKFSITEDDEHLVVDQRGSYAPPAGGAGYISIPIKVECGCGCGHKARADHLICVNQFADRKLQLRWAPVCVDKALAEGKLARCRHDSSYHTPDQMVQVHASSRAAQRQYARRNAERVAFRCASNGEYYTFDHFQAHPDMTGQIWELENYRNKVKTHRQASDGTWVARESSAA